MSIVKMFSALLVGACVAHACATPVRAESLVKPGLSSSEPPGCGWNHPYHYRYHYRAYRPSPFTHPHAKRPRRTFPKNMD